MILRECATVLEGFGVESGSPGRIRTADQRINSPLYSSTESNSYAKISLETHAETIKKAASLDISLETKKRDLPRRLHFKDGGFYYVLRNKWTYVADTRIKAIHLYIERYADSEELRREAAELLSSVDEMRKYISEVYRRSKRNAADRKIEFRLTREDYDAIVGRADGRCEVSGIKFDLQLRRNSFRRPFAPSLDRINSRGSYCPSNCRLVACVVNAAMSDWGEEPFMHVAKHVSQRFCKECHTLIEGRT